MLSDETNDLFVSHATVWELLNKIGRGKLLLAGSSSELAFRRIQALGVTFVPIEQNDILAAAALPHHHSDPFDRMLIAQALARNLAIVTADDLFPLYNVSTLW